MLPQSNQLGRKIMKKSIQSSLFAFVILMILMSACSSPVATQPTAMSQPPTTTPTATPISSTSTPKPTPTAILPTATPISSTSTPKTTPTAAQPTATPKPTTGRIEGRVHRSDTNQPIVNATLYLCCLSNTYFPEGIVATAITDVQGKYAFNSVPPGQYYIFLGLRGLPEYGPPKFQDYPFCSDGIPEGWQAFINTSFKENPIQLLPPNMEFSIAEGDIFQKDVDMKDIKCKK
jgi:hypothetical protein